MNKIQKNNKFDRNQKIRISWVRLYWPNRKIYRLTVIGILPSFFAKSMKRTGGGDYFSQSIMGGGLKPIRG